ncbi:alanine--tRNA ligase [Candidatus Pacearchaeota archaeon CG_4_10_14_0_2_um_filter_05_32_18]|nr:MAG: alanine--tRNA ligase [Candidatus Pacearchaeota archaeon CG_4_10_14_0_2_um_filter_05_32_18]
MVKTRQELIKKYIEFFKKQNHKEIPSSSLIPENDPTVLFTTAGMHPLVPFLLGQKHPLGKRLVNVQKCIRTVDIEEVGDNVHHTFFEMMGNWSLGDYWKKDAIKMTLEFVTKELKIPKEKLAVSCFSGDRNAGKDKESTEIWISLGIPKERIAFLGKEDNWWGPAGEYGPCGPDTEIFYYTGKKVSKEFDPKDKKWVEIGNNVLMEYNKTKKGYEKATQKNVDFGGGVERTLAILNGLDDNYQTSIFLPIIKEIEKISGKNYGQNKETTKAIRIISDHIKAATFILADPKTIKPSNTEQGYVLRRLIRRAVRYGRNLGIKGNFTGKIAEKVIPIYPEYEELKNNKKFIIQELSKEESRFNETLEKGLKKFEEIIKVGKKEISGKDAFLLFQSYGFPVEMTQELVKEKGMKININEYNKEFQKHQELSRTATQGKFKSGLADNSEKTTKLHTATHMLNEALRIVLKDENIRQKGSNINPERLRFDFNFPKKLTEEELKKVEDLINKKISEGLKVTREEMSLKEAIDSGAHGEFGVKYPEIVSVYTIDKFSKEICTGPHVSNTKEIGHFKIIKEESVAAGIRRIKAVVE